MRKSVSDWGRIGGLLLRVRVFFLSLLPVTRQLFDVKLVRKIYVFFSQQGMKEEYHDWEVS